MPHPSRKIVEDAELAAAANPAAPAANERYAQMAREFRPSSLTATSGLRALLDEIDSQTGLEPPHPDTVRGKVGQSLIRLQSRGLWWLLRALRIRDKALRLTAGVISELEQEVVALRGRV